MVNANIDIVEMSYEKSVSDKRPGMLIISRNAFLFRMYKIGLFDICIDKFFNYMSFIESLNFPRFHAIMLDQQNKEKSERKFQSTNQLSDTNIFQVYLC
jgi:hypothetical protein